MSAPKGPTLVTIPPELCRFVLESLSSRDVIALRLVSRAFYNYFTSEEVCHYAHKLYFPLSSECSKMRRTRKDFDAAYFRSMNWKQGRPSRVEIIEKVARASTSLTNGFLVDSTQNLLIYQRSRGVIVIKDLSHPVDDAAADTVITLCNELGECIMKRSESILLRDGESIRMSTNRGMLLVVGEAHVHPQPQECRNSQAIAGEGSGFFSWLNWAWGTSSSPPLPPRTFFQHPHSLCAVFSTGPQDRGKLLHTWLERDSFIIETALNEFYAIAEFDLVEQRLEGYIFPRAGKSSSKLNKRFSFTSAISQHTDGAEAGHHFTIRKKALYPQPSSFSIAPDTRGKVFYLGFLPPSADRRPVVEVHAVPQFSPADGTWSECSVIKRVVLRSLGLFPGVTNGLTRSSFWVDFDDGTTVRNFKRSKIGPSGKFAWDPDEDVVRLRMKGDLGIPGVTEEGESVNMVTWVVTARPSPIQPSAISDWRNGREWAVIPDNIIHDSNASPYANENGEIDYEDVYPTPTYYTRPRDLQNFLNQLELLPPDVELDTLEGANESGNYPPYLWVKNQEKINKKVYALFSKMSPGMLVLDPEVDASGGHGKAFLEDPSKHTVYPPVPGVNDGDFRPPGVLMKTKYKVELEVGRKIAVHDVQPVKQVPKKGKSRFLGRVRDDAYTSTDDSLTPSEGGMIELPVPGFNEAPRDRVLTRMDKMNKKFWVYGKEPELRRKGEILEEPIGDRIVIVRFD
ncbi:unnamed protein product [Tuber melanosporum]|uniref:(Perigord truffle) hypothetical protein n=1 Tax=Tuber melanosporum (strain Mel28) TaxID=656061 RepID=D5GPG0_TUBMM|nr:uncharacterized protein GSTUM_00011830001 [Tuber melanosporum]CAZ86403.1 unnamed protein product [Tuber melanosporum]